MASYKEDPDRVDQIVRVDATALLKTIRELEYKLTEHQKAEKQPAWAKALEQRLEQLENTFYSSQAKRGSFNVDQAAQPPIIEESSVAPVPTESAAVEMDSSAKLQVEGDQSHKEHETHDHEEVSHEAKADLPKRSVVDMATEMRVIGKVRKEIDNKFHTAENHLDSKLSAVNLQMDRLMKLLQIRPTTSELQTVMNAVYDVEKKVTTTMDDIRTDVRATLKSRISEEIVQIIDEVNQSKDLNDNGLKFLRTTVEGFQAEMADIREVTENTVVILNEQMDGVKAHNHQLEFNIGAMNGNMNKQLTEQSKLIATLRAEQSALVEEFQNYKSFASEEAFKVSVSASEEKSHYEAEIARLEASLEGALSRVEACEREVLGVQLKADADIAVQASINKKYSEAIADHLIRLDKLRRDTDTLTNADYTAQIKNLQEELKKANAGIVTNAEAIEKFVNGDLKTLNVKVALLQEQCNIQIPNAYGEMAMRIDGLNEHLQLSNGAIDKLQVKLHATDETVGELLPLMDRTTRLEAHSTDHAHEVQSLKESLTNTIDTTDELIRRMEECEENMEGMENSVTNRMNQMRDALIDTVLEKQSETNLAMRNVRENLEVMSRAGEGPVNLASLTSAGPRAGSGGGTGNSVKMNNNAGNNLTGSASMGNLGNSSGKASPSNVPLPSVSARVGSSGSSRKNSAAAPGANQGTRASVNSDNGLDGDAFDMNNFSNNTNANSLHGGDSIGSLGRGMNGMNVNYSRPTMAGQELRGMAPPMMSRESSMRGLMSKQSSLKGNNLIPSVNMSAQNNSVSPANAVNSFQEPTMSARSNNNGANLQLGSPNRDPVIPAPASASTRTMHSAPSQKTPPPSAPSSYPYESRDSPGPVEFSSTMNSTGGAANNNSDTTTNTAPSPRVTSVSVKATPQQQPSSTNYQMAPVSQNTNVGNVAYSVQQVQQQPPQVLNQVRYNPPEQSAPKYQLQNNYEPVASNSLASNNINHNSLDAYHYVPHEYQHFQQAQFLADLCLNFEEISVKRKRVANVPTVMCESIADITQEMAEFMARAADFEMVQYMLASVIGPSNLEINYDENIVLTKRSTKIEEYLSHMTNLVLMNAKAQNPGMVRLDARSLFLSLVKKSLDMFMSKHNQVLVVGNSRLGRVKIPSCLACDRPLIDKVRLDSVASRGGTRGDHSLSSQQGPSSLLNSPPGNSNQHNFNFGNIGFNQGSAASFGYNAIENGAADDDDGPASSVASDNTRYTNNTNNSTATNNNTAPLAPIGNKKLNSLPGVTKKKAADKLPEVQ